MVLEAGEAELLSTLFKTISRCIMVRCYQGKLLLGLLKTSQICASSTVITEIKVLTCHLVDEWLTHGREAVP